VVSFLGKLSLPSNLRLESLLCGSSLAGRRKLEDCIPAVDCESCNAEVFVNLAQRIISGIYNSFIIQSGVNVQ
jgi:hypothetical protein